MTEYALALRLIDAGIEPDVMLGASLGSFAAATVAGCMSEEDAMAALKPDRPSRRCRGNRSE